MSLVHENDDGPRGGVPKELARLFEEALRCLGSTDLPGAKAALKEVHAEVARGTDETGNEPEDRG